MSDTVVPQTPTAETPVIDKLNFIRWAADQTHKFLERVTGLALDLDISIHPTGDNRGTTEAYLSAAAELDFTRKTFNSANSPDGSGCYEWWSNSTYHRAEVTVFFDHDGYREAAAAVAELEKAL